MAPYTFRILLPLADAVSRVISLETDAEAVAFGRKLLRDWPDCEAIEIAATGGLVDKLRQSPAS
jgi:hypothetical protein